MGAWDFGCLVCGFCAGWRFGGGERGDHLLSARLDDLPHRSDPVGIVADGDGRGLARHAVHDRVDLDAVERARRRLDPLLADRLEGRRHGHAGLLDDGRPRIAFLVRQLDPQDGRVVAELLALGLAHVGLDPLGVHGDVLLALLLAHRRLDNRAPHRSRRRRIRRSSSSSARRWTS